ncbi:MAG TPA: long-chain fatty acid--CoA ligase [Alkalispirochaeta sp.]|nr:long-chain fatty acid--CoA ligase [Alkalispirochaeta sp.]
MLRYIAATYPDTPAQMSRGNGGAFQSRSYAELQRSVHACAAGLQKLGVQRGTHVGLVSENREEWFTADLAILSLGAADVPRGNDSTTDELAFILSVPECPVAIVENKAQLEKVLESVRAKKLPALKHLIIIDGEISAKPARGIAGHQFLDVVATGERALEKDATRIDREIDAGSGDEVATIIFTSGTTGEPKGVMLTHDNFLYQVQYVPDRIDAAPGDIWLCVLPVWHSFERIVQYIALFTATTLAYSKPIGTIMLADMAEIRPKWMASVPRIWEAVRAGIYRNIKAQGGAKEALFTFFVAVGGTHKHLTDMIRGLVPDFKPRNRTLDAVVAFGPWLLLTPLKALGNLLVFGKIKARLGGRFVAGVSGGGALPPAVDAFFGSAGVLLLEGYGLTETAPVLAVRSQFTPIPGTVGTLLPGTECSIRDEQGDELSPGQMGTIFVRGPQVMQGYYQRSQLTEAVLDAEGWLNTGDLGMLSHRGELKITGRAKDTIVLLGGENIEPLPIEQKLQESEYIERAVVVGQDQKYLAALICPSMDAIISYADENHVPYMDTVDVLEDEAIRELIATEVSNQVNRRTGFKGFELIYRSTLIPDDFEVGRELSAKQEIKRHVINERYQSEIAALFL